MHSDPQWFGDITTQVVSNDWQSTQKKKTLKPRKLNLRFHYWADLWHILEMAVKDVDIYVLRNIPLRKNW